MELKKEQKVKVEFNVRDYTKAIEAHKANRYIKIKGQLNWGIRLHNLDRHTSFELA